MQDGRIARCCVRVVARCCVCGVRDSIISEQPGVLALLKLKIINSTDILLRNASYAGGMLHGACTAS